MLVRFHIPLLLLALAGTSGCSLIYKESWSEPPSLPGMQMSSDTVVLEIAFVKVNGEALKRQEDLWRQIDEQPVAADVRRKWQENGLRVGVVNSQLPEQLRKLLEQTPDSPAGKNLQTPDDVTASQRQLQSRAGKRNVILAGGPQDKLALLLQDQGHLTGSEYQQAQCLFGVKTFPQGDGRVRMELVPEIEHGEMRQRYVGHDGSFHIESGKPHKVLDALKMHLTLAPGEVVVIGCTPEPKGLGKLFFSPGATQEQKLLMIRLSQTQCDDTFAPETLREPIATPDE